MDVIKINSNIVYCTGDIHGEFDLLEYTIRNYNITDSTLIVCGDCCFGFHSASYYENHIRDLEKTCAKRNTFCFFLRGNHDDPNYFNGDLFKTGNVRTLRDYSVIQTYKISDKEKMHPCNNILCVGGAISIDRLLRKQQMNVNANIAILYNHNITFDEAYERNRCYWENEKPYYDEKDLETICNSGIVIDTVCTHTCPSIFAPFFKNGIETWLENDELLNEDLDYERYVMDKILMYLKEHNNKPKKWIYGHYHYHNNERIDGIEAIMLDMARKKIDMYQINE